MVTRVERISIAFDPDDNFRVTPEPGGLHAKRRSGGRSKDRAFTSEIYHRAARLGRELGPKRVDTLQHRLLRLSVALPQERQLRLGGGRAEQESEQEPGLAHQSATPDQSGSEPSWGVVNWRGSPPSR